MVPASYHDFFTACASVAGALIGLLFVAVSIAPHQRKGEPAPTRHRIRAGLAFSALLNSLVMALVALLPGTGLGTAGVVLGATGLSSMAGLVVVGLRDEDTRKRPSVFYRPLIQAALFVLQIIDAVALMDHPRTNGPLDDEAYLAIVFFLVAVDRAWELVGGRDSGLLGILIRERSSPDEQTRE